MIIYEYKYYGTDKICKNDIFKPIFTIKFGCDHDVFKVCFYIIDNIIYSHICCEGLY